MISNSSEEHLRVSSSAEVFLFDAKESVCTNPSKDANFRDANFRDTNFRDTKIEESLVKISRQNYYQNNLNFYILRLQKSPQARKIFQIDAILDARSFGDANVNADLISISKVPTMERRRHQSQSHVDSKKSDLKTRRQGNQEVRIETLTTAEEKICNQLIDTQTPPDESSQETLTCKLNQVTDANTKRDANQLEDANIKKSADEKMAPKTAQEVGHELRSISLKFDKTPRSRRSSSCN